jgi:hypothetical protein
MQPPPSREEFAVEVVINVDVAAFDGVKSLLPFVKKEA